MIMAMADYVIIIRTKDDLSAINFVKLNQLIKQNPDKLYVLLYDDYEEWKKQGSQDVSPNEFKAMLTTDALGPSKISLSARYSSKEISTRVVKVVCCNYEDYELFGKLQDAGAAGESRIGTVFDAKEYNGAPVIQPMDDATAALYKFYCNPLNGYVQHRIRVDPEHHWPLFRAPREGEIGPDGQRTLRPRPVSPPNVEDQI